MSLQRALRQLGPAGSGPSDAAQASAAAAKALLAEGAAMDEAAFVAHLRTTSWASWTAIAKDPAAAWTLLDALVAKDYPNAVKALRQQLVRVPGHAQVPAVRTLAQRAWSEGRHACAYLLVVEGAQSAATYTARFPHARRAWTALVDAGLLHPARHLERFPAELDEVLRWLRCARITPQACAALVVQQPAVGEVLAILGCVDHATAARSLARRPQLAIEPPPPYVQQAPARTTPAPWHDPPPI